MHSNAAAKGEANSEACHIWCAALMVNFASVLTGLLELSSSFKARAQLYPRAICKPCQILVKIKELPLQGFFFISHLFLFNRPRELQDEI